MLIPIISMKSKFFMWPLVVALTIFSFSCQSKDHSEEESIKMLQQFYTTYMTNIAGSIEEDKSEEIRKQYCTAKLLKKIEQLELDYDPFIKGQDASIENVKTILVKKDAQKANAYIVS